MDDIPGSPADSIPRDFAQPPLQFAVADDDPDWLVLLSRMLRKASPTAAIWKFADGKEALAHLKAKPLDLLVTNHKMTTMHGPELVKEARSLATDLPIIMVSNNPSVGAEGIEAGVDVFVDKDEAMQRLHEIAAQLLRQRNGD